MGAPYSFGTKEELDGRANIVGKAIVLFEQSQIGELEKWLREMKANTQKDFHAIKVVQIYIRKYYEG